MDINSVLLSSAVGYAIGQGLWLLYMLIRIWIYDRQERAFFTKQAKDLAAWKEKVEWPK